MALTLQDIIAKRKELGPNATNVQAREALVTNPPVPVTPTPIAPTVNVQEQMAGKTVEERQAMRSGTTTPSGATLNANGTIANAPLPTEQQINAQYGGVIQDNGINSVQPKVEQAPVKQPEPVKQVASEVTSKVESPIDYTQAKGREAEITANLDSFKAKGMTPEEIMRASDYQNASPEKKALIEPYLKIQTPTASAMYNAIASKSDIPDDQKTSLSYKIANNRYIKANMYSTMTPSQLSSEMTNSKLIQGSQAYEDLKAMNPKLVQDTENLRIVNGSKQNVFTYTNNPDGTLVKTNNLENTFAQDYIDNFGEEIKKMYAIQTPEEIRAIINTPDVVAAQDKATEIELTMNELEKQIDQVDSDVENEMKGSGATGSRIALEKAIRKDKLEKEYNSQLKNYTTYANKANNLITQNTTLYTTSQAQKQAQNAAMLPFITDQYKTEQEKIKAEEALKDPATAIKSVMDEYKKLGIPFTSTVQSRLAEFKASGKSLEQFLTDMGKNIQQSPAYKQYEAQQAGKGVSYQTIGDSVYRQNPDGSLTKTNISAVKAKDAVREETPWEIVTIDGKSKERNKYTGETRDISVTGSTTGKYNQKNDSLTTITLENGKPIKMLSEPATALATLINGNPDVKIDYNNLYRDQADQYRLYGKGRTSEQLMKEGIPSLYADPTAKKVTWTTKSQHMTGSAVDLVKPTAETIAKMNAAGFYQPEATKKAGDSGHFEYNGVTDSAYSEPDITIFNSMSPTDKKKSQNDPAYRAFLTDYSKTMKDKNAPLEDILKFSSGQKTMGDAESKSLDKFSQALGQVSTIQEQISKMDTGPILGRLRNMNPYDTDAQVLKAQLQALIPNLARGVYGEVGVLTDADIANYAKTIPNLTSTKDVNNAILAMTLQTMGTGYKSQLQSLASAKNDVSGYGGLYNQYMDIVNSLKAGNTQSNISGSTVGGEINASNGNTYTF